MVKMKALVEFPYFGKALRVGEPFEASESDAHILSLVGRAEVDGNRADAETHHNADPSQQYKTRDLSAAPVSAGRRGRRAAS